MTVKNALRRAKAFHGTSGDPSDVLAMASRILDRHGVECIRDVRGDVVAEYVNAGEAYSTTVIFDCLTRRYCIESMGDFIERKERARADRNGFKAA